MLDTLQLCEVSHDAFCSLCLQASMLFPIPPTLYEYISAPLVDLFAQNLWFPAAVYLFSPQAITLKFLSLLFASL